MTAGAQFEYTWRADQCGQSMVREVNFGAQYRRESRMRNLLHRREKKKAMSISCSHQQWESI
jgi:hypothetical protein